MLRNNLWTQRFNQKYKFVMRKKTNTGMLKNFIIYWNKTVQYRNNLYNFLGTRSTLPSNLIVENRKIGEKHIVTFFFINTLHSCKELQMLFSLRLNWKVKGDKKFTSSICFGRLVFTINVAHEVKFCSNIWLKFQIDYKHV